jgi:hypothetical protein
LGVKIDRAIGEGDADAHVGEAPAEFDERRRQVLHPERERRIDAQQTTRMPRRSRDFVLKAIDGIDQPPAGVEIGLPFRRQRQLAGRAVDKTHAEPGFQTRNELGNGRRREPQIAGGAGECATFDGAHEHAHLGQLVHGSCLEFTNEVPRTLIQTRRTQRICPSASTTTPQGGQRTRSLTPDGGFLRHDDCRHHPCCLYAL